VHKTPVKEHKVEGSTHTYYTDAFGRICDRHGVPFRNRRDRRAAK
jgi:hypothetical protein